MFHVLNAMPQACKQFLRDEEGAQIIEYALIIAVVSLALILAIRGLAQTDFQAWIDRVGDLLNPPAAGGGDTPPAGG